MQINLQIPRSYFIIVLHWSLIVGCLTFGRSHADGKYIFIHFKPLQENERTALVDGETETDRVGESREMGLSERGSGKVWSVSDDEGIVFSS